MEPITVEWLESIGFTCTDIGFWSCSKDVSKENSITLTSAEDGLWIIEFEGLYDRVEINRIRSRRLLENFIEVCTAKE